MRLLVPAYVPLAEGQLRPGSEWAPESGYGTSAEDTRDVEIELNLSLDDLETYRQWLRAVPQPPITTEIEWTAWDIRWAVWWALGRPTVDFLDIGFIGGMIRRLT